MIRCALTHNLAVPEQLSVIGFDDMMMDSYSTPGITTIRQPKYELGQTQPSCFYAESEMMVCRLFS
jgi:DNA-binding LacI/PurR family transcriptional regulator